MTKHSNLATVRKKVAKKEPKTKTFGFKIDSSLKEKMDNKSKGEKKRLIDFLRDSLATLTDDEYITTTRLRRELDLEEVSCRIQIVEREIQATKEKLHDLEQLRQKYKTTYQEIEVNLKEERAKESKKKQDLNQFANIVVGLYLQEHDSLLCQEVLLEYLEKGYSNKDCINAIKKYAIYNEGKEIHFNQDCINTIREYINKINQKKKVFSYTDKDILINKRTIIMDKSLKRDILNLANNLEIGL